MKDRPPGWEAALARALVEAECQTFAYGYHDCVTAACALADAAMGCDLLGFVCQRWDERRARVLLATFGGITGWLHVVARMSWLVPVHPPAAHRGALVTVRTEDGELRAGCLLGADVAVVGPAGLRRIPRSYVESGWQDE